MDEGGIYEDGTPEQIFEAPLKENTRRFIKRLKVLEFDIDKMDYDYIGMSEDIEQYAIKNQFPYALIGHIRLAFEELVHLTLMPALFDPKVHVSIKYSATENTATMEVLYNGPQKNVLENEAQDKRDDYSLKLLKGTTKAVKYETAEGELGNRITIVW